MSERLTPEDADLVARRVTARLGRLVAAVLLTLATLWILPVVFLYSFRSVGPQGSTGADVVTGALALGAAVLMLVALAVIWRRVLRGEP